MMNNGTTTEIAPVQAGETNKKKITLATVKSFMRKNAENLWAKTESSFDGMIDCVAAVKGEWKRANPSELLEKLVGSRGARDFYRHYENGPWIGIEVSNCCGCWIVATNIE